MEKKTSTELIVKMLLKLGGFFVVLSFLSFILLFIVNNKICVMKFIFIFYFYFFSGIICIIMVLAYIAHDICKSSKQKSKTDSFEKTEQAKDIDYQREKDKLCALRNHEERMAIIKAFGANYTNKMEEETLVKEIEKLIDELNRLKQS